MGQVVEKEKAAEVKNHPFVVEYLDHERRQGANKKRLMNRSYDLKKLFAYLDEQALNLLSLTPSQARGFKLYLKQFTTRNGKSLTPGSCSKIFFQVKTFYRYLKETNRIAENPFSGIRNPKRDETLPRKPITEKQMDRFLNQLKYWWDEEANLLFLMGRYLAHVQSELMYSSGLRASEAAHLTEEDIDLERGEIFVRCGKGEKDRIAYLSTYACEILKIYLREMRPLVLRGESRTSETLFGVAGGQYTKRLNQYLREASEREKLPRQTSHCFRHAFGSHLLRAGCDIRKIQGLLGHDKLRTTQVYTKLEKDDLKDVLNQYHPRKMDASWISA